MPSTRRLGSKSGLERLVFYSDAVCAIAITLLVLPLTDALVQYTQSAHSQNAGFLEVISREPYRSMLIAMIISFYAIARLWLSHHQIFEGVLHFTSAMAFVDLVWLLSIVLLPLPTAFLVIQKFNDSTFIAYLGLIFASSLLLTLLAAIIDRTPGLAGEGVETRARFVGGVINAGGFALALVLGLIFPGLGYYAIGVSLLSTPAQLWYNHRQAKRAAT
jgi:uncharacterized membrane protein